MDYCGLLCNECPLYIATKNDNEETKAKLAIEYSNEHCTFTKEDMNCEVCYSVKNNDSKMCGDCKIRNCSEGKNNLKNCGYCSSYPCGLIDKYCPVDCRARLDKISISSREYK